MICCHNFLMAWFWRYDFYMFWYGFNYDFDIGQNCHVDVGQKCDFCFFWGFAWFCFAFLNDFKTFENISESHRNHIEIPSKLNQNCGNTSNSNQNQIKTVSKSYQNNIKTYQNQNQKTSRNGPKACPGAVSVSFLEANPPEPYQNQINFVSNSSQNRKAVSTP